MNKEYFSGENTETEFEINLPEFEGPFDLLLFFIERDELDIYNIPISKITDDFLNYIHRLNAINMEVASEFIYVAATLMRIKAKMLLPRPQLDETGNEIDPKEELINRLLIYKQFKDTIPEFSLLEDTRFQIEKRGYVEKELQQIMQDAGPEDEMSTLDLYKLLLVYEKVMSRSEQEKRDDRHVVVQYPYSIEEQKRQIQQLLAMNKTLSFQQMMLDSKDKVQLIYSFMAILEMLQQQLIELNLGEGFNNFWVRKVG